MKSQIFVTSINVEYDEASVIGTRWKRKVNIRTSITADVSTESGNLSVKVSVHNYVPKYGEGATPEDIVRKILAEAVQC